MFRVKPWGENFLEKRIESWSLVCGLWDRFEEECLLESSAFDGFVPAVAYELSGDEEITDWKLKENVLDELWKSEDLKLCGTHFEIIIWILNEDEGLLSSFLLNSRCLMLVRGTAGGDSRGYILIPR